MLILNSPTITINDSPIVSLVLVVVDSITEVFFLCFVGFILASNGIIDDKAKKTLNKMNVNLFTPALLFSKVAFTLTPAKLRELFVIPIGFVLITGFSAAVAYILGSLFRLKKSQRDFAIACSMFQNSNSLPIALMQSLIGEKMPIQWGLQDTKDEMLGRALTYLVLYSTLGIIVRWSFGVKLLTSVETAEAEPIENEEVSEGSDLEDREAGLYGDQAPLLSNGNSKDMLIRKSSLGQSVPKSKSLSRKRSTISFADQETLVTSSNSNSPPLVQQVLPSRIKKRRKGRPQSIFQSFPNTPGGSRHTSDRGESSDEEGGASGDEEWGGRRGIGRDYENEVESYRGEQWRRVKFKIRKVLKRVGKICDRISAFMTVPLWAALLSLFVACTPPLQTFLHDIEPLKASIKRAGDCSVPITLVTLGAYFYVPSTSPSFFSKFNLFKKADSGYGDNSIVEIPPAVIVGETKTVLVAVASRMIVTPLLLVPLFATYALATTNVADDPVFIVVACLLIGSPTAITLAQITSTASGVTFEKLISRTLLYSYAFLTAPCTIGLVLSALYIAKKEAEI